MHGASCAARAAATTNAAAAGAATSAAETEEKIVDFANAGLYLSGIQTVFTICCCALVSVLSCWIVPAGVGVSAVRTLAICAATGALLMRTPLRVGRAHGVRVVFSALQPAVPIYLTSLIVEQIVHTCTSETEHSPSWRRVVFHSMVAIMMVSGLMRARAPLQETDVQFLLTASALLVVAVMPPPAVAFVGPLCQAVTIWEAAERIVRAFAFALVYCAHVYASTSSSSLTNSETIIVVTRSTSASLWVMGAHITWLPIAALQCGVVIVARIKLEQNEIQNKTTNCITYRQVPDRHDDDASDDLEADLHDVADTPPMQPQPLAGAPQPQPPQPPLAAGFSTVARATDASSGGIDVVAQQRELLAQPTAIQLSHMQLQPQPHHHHHHHPQLQLQLQLGESSSSGMPPQQSRAGAPLLLPPAPAVQNNNDTMMMMSPADSMGPMTFREVGPGASDPAPTQQQQHAQLMLRPPPPLQQQSTGRTVAQPQRAHSKEYLARIAAEIPE